jgi:hypothetical protein
MSGIEIASEYYTTIRKISWRVDRPVMRDENSHESSIGESRKKGRLMV